MKPIFHCGFSGGGVKISGLLGAAERIWDHHGNEINVVSGVSSGSIIAILWATGQLFREDVRDTILKMTLKTFFKRPPVKPNGKFTTYALWQAITGAPALGDQSNLTKQLKKFITVRAWDEYVRNPGSPPVYVGCVDHVNGSRYYPNLKDYDRLKAFDLVQASSSIPVFTAPVHLGGRKLYDGGNRDHSPTAYMMAKFKNQIEQNITVYTRPKEPCIEPLGQEEAQNMSWLENFVRVVDVFNMETSKNDEFQENTFARKYKIKHDHIFLPSIMHSPYDVNHGRLYTLYKAGQVRAEDVLQKRNYKN